MNAPTVMSGWIEWEIRLDCLSALVIETALQEISCAIVALNDILGGVDMSYRFSWTRRLCWSIFL